ncbi:hypothetical protein GQ457_16G016190 [Hibiscus cannabinus]
MLAKTLTLKLQKWWLVLEEEEGGLWPPFLSLSLRSLFPYFSSLLNCECTFPLYSGASRVLCPKGERNIPLHVRALSSWLMGSAHVSYKISSFFVFLCARNAATT